MDLSRIVVLSMEMDLSSQLVPSDWVDLSRIVVLSTILDLNLSFRLFPVSGPLVIVGSL